MDQELISYLDKRFDETTRRISEETARQIGTVREDLRTEIREQIGTVREELRTEIREQVGTVREELRTEIGTVREDLRSDVATVRDDLRTEIRQLGVTVEALRGQIQTVAEGVVTVDEKLERFRQENSAEHEEIKSMIKFSYAELDRRIGHLEGRTNSLETRIARLESVRT